MLELNSVQQSLYRKSPNSQRFTPAVQDSREIEIQTNERYIQWRYKGSKLWVNLIAIKELKGEVGAKGLQGDKGIQGEQGGVGEQGIQGEQGITGETGLTGEKGNTGPQGLKGETGVRGTDGKVGKPGTDGRKIQLRKTATHVQWRYAGDEFWTNLISLEDIRGERGKIGARGEKGEKGERGIPGYAGVSGERGPTGPQGYPGPAGANGAATKANQLATPSPDGIVTTFTAPQAYLANSLVVTINGLVEVYFNETSPTTFTLQDAPVSTDIIRLAYNPA